MKKVMALETGAKFLEATLSTISSAVAGDEIIANYFVVRSDFFGEMFLGQLFQAAARGVQVTLIIDSYGGLHPSGHGTEYESEELPAAALAALMDIGVDVLVYRPIHSTRIFSWANLTNWTNFSRRNHSKCLTYNLKSKKRCGAILGDSQWAKEHFNGQLRGNNLCVEDPDFFRDVREYHHELIESLDVCYPRLFFVDLAERKTMAKKFEAVPRYGSDSLWRETQFVVEDIEFVSSEITYQSKHKRASLQDREIELLRRATSQAHYMTPYFCPDRQLIGEFQRLFKKSSVEFSVLMSKFREHPYIPYGTRRAVGKLLEHKNRIHEYVGAGNIHHKDMVVDDLSFIKSSNGDGRSRFYNLEVGVIVKSAEYAQFNRDLFNLEMRKSRPIDLKGPISKDKTMIKRALKDLACPLYYHHL